MCTNEICFPNYIVTSVNFSMAEALEPLSEVADSVPVDISTLKASDSVQSHLSTMNSAKRLRLGNASINNKGLSAHLRMPDAMNGSAQGFVQAIFSPSHLTLPTAYTPTRQTRLERPICFKSIKYGILLYCFLSCVITSVRLYINLYGKKIVHDGTVKISGPLPCNFFPAALVNAIIFASRISFRQQWRRIPCALFDKNAGNLLWVGYTRTVYTVKHTSQLVCDSMRLGKRFRI